MLYEHYKVCVIFFTLAVHVHLDIILQPFFFSNIFFLNNQKSM